MRDQCAIGLQLMHVCSDVPYATLLDAKFCRSTTRDGFAAQLSQKCPDGLQALLDKHLMLQYS